VIHDLKNHSPTAGTLYAATGNGIYAYIGTIPWNPYQDTLGFRVLEVAPDPVNQYLYAIARPSKENGVVDTPPVGELYRLDLSAGATGAFTPIDLGYLSKKTAIAIAGSGDLLIGTEDGRVYRLPGGDPTTKTYRAFSAEPINDLMASPANPSQVFMVQGSRVYVSPDSGQTWPEEKNFGSGIECLTLGENAAGEVLLGTKQGDVWLGDAGTWSSYGTGLPSESVTGFGTGPAGQTFAVIDREYAVLADYDQPAGLYQMPGSPTGIWTQWNGLDVVSTHVTRAVPFQGDLYISFRKAGIYRLDQGDPSYLPGEARDEGIGAVSLEGLAIDPRSQGRALAFGPSGLYERYHDFNRDLWTWRPILLGSITNISDPRAVQQVREAGFLSAAFNEDRTEVIWAGGEGTGLLKGEQIPAGSASYQWNRVFSKVTKGAGNVVDVCPDPFDRNRIWLATNRGIHLSTDEGGSFLPVTPETDDYHIDEIAFQLVPPEDRLFLSGRYHNGSNPTEGLLASDDGVSWQAALYSNVNLSSVTFNAYNPFGIPRALVGLNNAINERMAIRYDNGIWQVDSDVAAPVLSPNIPNPIFRSLRIPLGVDKDNFQDAFAVIWSNSNSEKRVYRSTATSNGFSPGENWEQITDGLDSYSPSSLEVDPKDGDRIWVATKEASAFTRHPGMFIDLTPPSFFPAQMEGVGSTDTTITLQWNAPGDDGNFPGWADRYELRYSTSVFGNADDFDTWGTFYPQISPPHVAGRIDTTTVNVNVLGIPEVAFALRAYDEHNQSSGVLTTGLQRPIARAPLDVAQPQSSGNRVVLSWNSNALAGDPYFQNFGRIMIERTSPAYMMTILGVNATTWTDSGADVGGFEPGDRVTYTLTAEDGAGNGAASFASLIIPTGSGGGGGGGGGCFIATAAYGSAMEPEVQTLRLYRDRYLRDRVWGRMLVGVYEITSPKLAAMVADRPQIRSLIRIALKPIVLSAGVVDPDGLLAFSPVFIGLIVLIVPFGLILFSGCWIVRACNRKR
jgi:hypothetical protein